MAQTHGTKSPAQTFWLLFSLYRPSLPQTAAFNQGATVYSEHIVPQTANHAGQIRDRGALW